MDGKMACTSIKREMDSSFNLHQFFRKKSHMNEYVHVESHHHPTQKNGVIDTLTTRAFKISYVDHL
jgi:hypothetical protein